MSRPSLAYHALMEHSACCRSLVLLASRLRCRRLFGPLLHMMHSHYLPSLNSYQQQHGMQAEQRKNQPTPSTPSTRAERLLLTADGCA
jgi:hypothetical protein